MERIFDAIDPNASTPADFVNDGDSDGDDQYTQTVRKLIEDAVSYEESMLRPDREEADEYYYGEEPALSLEDDEEVEGRSTIVSTDVRDTIMAMVPSLMRIFTGTENIVDYCPTTEQEVDSAKEATDVANYIYWEDNDGFLLTHSILKDCLTKKIAAVTWWTDDEHQVEYKSFEGVSQEQLQLIIHEGKDVEILDINQSETDPNLVDVKIRFTKSKPLIKIRAMPLDQFRISPFAENVSEAPTIGWEGVVRKSFVVERGFDPEMVEQYTGSMTPGWSEELEYRMPGVQGYTMDDGVLFGEYYVHIDSDGDGINEVHKITVIGEDRHIIEDEIEPYIRWAVFCPDPRAHAVVGDCPADITKDIQKVKTAMLRGSMDSLAQSIFPRTIINDMITNVDDAMNQELGAVIRARGDVRAAIDTLDTPFVGDKVFGMMDRIDMLRQSRTGISEASKGVDPKALQSTNLMGIDAIVSGAQERIELVARILAHTGFKELFRGILREIVAAPNPERFINIRGQWKTINPSTYNPDMKVKVNPTLGKGSDIVRLQALRDIKDTQLMILGKFGIKNPVVTPSHFRNTIQDMANLVNVRDVSRYFAEITPEMEKAMMDAPEPPDPNLILAQAQMEKVKAETSKAIAEKQTKTDKLQTDEEFRRNKFRADDDFRRDQMELHGLLEAASILGQWGASVEKNATVQGENTPDQSNPLLSGQ